MRKTIDRSSTFRRRLYPLTASLFSVVAFASPESELARASLSVGTQARLESVLGPFDKLPLYLADLRFTEQGRRVDGTVDLLLSEVPSKREVWLRLSPNARHPGSVKIAKASLNESAMVVEQKESTLLRLSIPSTASAPLRLKLSLEATLPQCKAAPVDLSTVLSMGQNTPDCLFSATSEFVSLLGIIPTLATQGLNGPRWSAPATLGDLSAASPSNFVVSLLAPKGFQIVAPGELLGSVPDEAGGLKSTFALGAARDFAVVLSKKTSTERRSAAGVTFEATVQAEHEPSRAKVLDLATSALELSAQKLGPYPYRRLKIVECPNLGTRASLEFSGLMCLSPMLLGNGNALLANSLPYSVNLQIAHQYFGQLVGNDSVSAPLVDEAFSVHWALLVTQWQSGDEAAATQRERKVKAGYRMFRALGGSDGKADRAASQFRSPLEFDAMIFSKGPLLLDAQRELLGDELWTQALQSYVRENAFRTVDATTFGAVAARTSPKNAQALNALHRRWWTERHGDEDVGGATDFASQLNALQNSLGNLPQMGGNQTPAIDPKVMKAFQKAIRQLSGGSP